jgi:GTPase SAR1 family protein
MATKPREEATEPTGEQEVILPFRKRRINQMLSEVPPIEYGRRREVALEAVPTTSVDLSGKPKVWLFVGAGQGGKTTVIRCLVGWARDQRRDVELAALDPGSIRSLTSWFPGGVEEAPENEAARTGWLRDLLLDEAEDPRTLICDFGGGGHVPLLDLVRMAKEGVHSTLEAAGIGLVMCYVLTPRIDDAEIIKDFEEAGFKPRATLLLLNSGKVDSSQDIGEAFEPVRRHEGFRMAVKRGAVTVTMPRLDPVIMQEIELKRLSFDMARTGKVPPGRTFPPIAGLNRSIVATWMDDMVQAFKPVATWLP